ARERGGHIGQAATVMSALRPAEPGEHPERARDDVDRESEQESVNPPWCDSQLDRLCSDDLCVHVAYLGLPHLPTGRADRRRAGRRRGEFEPKLPERPATEPSGVTQFSAEVKKCALRSPRASRPERPGHALRRAIPFRVTPAIESGADTDPTAARWCFFTACSTDCWWCARWSPAVSSRVSLRSIGSASAAASIRRGSTSSPGRGSPTSSITAISGR